MRFCVFAKEYTEITWYIAVGLILENFFFPTRIVSVHRGNTQHTYIHNRTQIHTYAPNNAHKHTHSLTHTQKPRSTAGLGAISDGPGTPPIPLEAIQSPFVDKLRVNHDSESLARASKPGAAGAISTRGGGAGGTALRLAIRSSRGGTLYVGTIRMGFGHHRIAYAASSWGLEGGMVTYFHDLLNVASREAKIIKNADG